ncbi:MAG: formamidopyrimidine-DNA glycosylase [Ignavibacteriales bacterium]|nr:formamidopyrimidine-DNA glycosylase [Ignavibacteriales bacterium]
MPELPDITVYQEALRRRITGSTLEKIRFANPFLLRSVSPSPEKLEGRLVLGVERIGKRIVIALEPDFFIVLHLMIAGRLRWKTKGAKVPGKVGHAAFDFSTGTLIVTEAGTKKRASLHLVETKAALQQFNPGGLEVLEATYASFFTRLTKENHTLKRSLTDPYLFSGIGNAYSDEILHSAKLSPLKQTSQLGDEEIQRLFVAIKETLTRWIERLKYETGTGFPEKVTAFRDGMAVHGRFGKACPVCSTRIQRIVYAQNECNYCPRCQTNGKLLADRAFSRLLKDDWPRTIEELEAKEGVNGP